MGKSKYIVTSEAGTFKLEEALLVVQSDLFSIGAEIASSVNKAFAPKRGISKSDVAKLEGYADAMSGAFPKLDSFVLPGGCIESSAADEARAVARRAERSLVNASNSTKIGNEHILAYMNRLSSFLFVAARFINYINGVKETPPDY
jgi:cob(I)alamin adenosyltransferase